MSGRQDDERARTHERRRFPRVTTSLTARVSNASEMISPDVSVVDISLGGALVTYDEPTGLMVNDRVVVSFDLPTSSVVLLARVARVAHGIDFLTYVAVEFGDGQSDEVDHLAEHLAEEHPDVELRCCVDG